MNMILEILIFAKNGWRIFAKNWLNLFICVVEMIMNFFSDLVIIMISITLKSTLISCLKFCLFQIVFITKISKIIAKQLYLIAYIMWLFFWWYLKLWYKWIFWWKLCRFRTLLGAWCSTSIVFLFYFLLLLFYFLLLLFYFLLLFSLTLLHSLIWKTTLSKRLLFLSLLLLL